MARKSITKKVFSMLAAAVMACSMAVSANAFTGGPAYGGTTDGVYTYSCKWTTATYNVTNKNQYFDGYCLIGKTSNNARRTIAVYTCIGNGSRTTSRFNNTIFNKPTSGPSSSSITVQSYGSALKYSDGSTVTTIQKTNSSVYQVEATKTWNYSNAISLCSTHAVTYNSGSYAEYTATVNW